jgi:hypothetical protein
LKRDSVYSRPTYNDMVNWMEELMMGLRSRHFPVLYSLLISWRAYAEAVVTLTDSLPFSYLSWSELYLLFIVLFYYQWMTLPVNSSLTLSHTSSPKPSQKKYLFYYKLQTTITRRINITYWTGQTQSYR